MTTPGNENPAGSQAPVFDPTRLAILMEMEEDGDTSMIKDIVVQFLEDITAVLARIEAFLGASEFSKIAGEAHTIKGSAATFGLYQVEKIARELEASAKDSSKNTSIPAIYESLREAFAAGREALEAYFAGR
jgi:HPt (histidine-containing phosphotransfer) domain-containing protein